MSTGDAKGPIRRWIGSDWALAGALYFAVIAAAYVAVVFFGHTLQPVSFTPYGATGSGPWDYAGRTPVNSFNLDLADPIHTMWPINELTGSLWRAGTVPLWNPYQGAGEPIAAQYSTRAFFPYQVLEVISPARLWDAFLLGRLWIAGLLTFAFLREVSLARLPALAGGLFYLLSGAFTWFIWLEQMVNVSMVVPLLFLFARRIADAGPGRAIVGAAVAMALVLLGGQPETALYVVFAATMYFAVMAWAGMTNARAFLTRSGHFVVAGFLGAALAAPLLAPFADHLMQGFNLHPAGGTMGVQDPVEPRWLPVIAFPTLFTLPRPPTVTPLNGLWDYIGGFTGAVVLVIALSQIGRIEARHRRDYYFFLCLSIALLLKNTGIPPFLWLGHLPLFDQAWSQRWAGCVWVFGFSVAAAIALSRIVTPRHPPTGDHDTQRRGEGERYGLNMVALAALSGFAIVAMFGRRSGIGIEAVLLLVVVVCVTGHRWHPFASRLAAYRWPHVRVASSLGFATAVLLSLYVVTAYQREIDFTLRLSLIPGATAAALAMAPLFALSATGLLAPSVGTTAMAAIVREWRVTTIVGLLLAAWIVAVVLYPPINVGQRAHFIPSTIVGPAAGMISAITAASMVVRGQSRARTPVALAVLACNELVFAIPRGFDEAARYWTILPWVLGYGAAWIAHAGRPRVALIPGVAAVMAWAVIATTAERGYPLRHEPFTKPPYVGFIEPRLANTYRVMGLGGAMFPNIASAYAVRDIHYIQSVAIRAVQNLADSHLRERPGHRGNRLWFTGYPVRDFADLLPAETLWFFRFAPAYTGRLYGPTIALERAKRDVTFGAKALSYLGVRFIVAPRDTVLRPMNESPENGPPAVVYDGEVRIFENPAALPRAFVVTDIRKSGSLEEAQRAAFASKLDLRRTAIIEAPIPPRRSADNRAVPAPVAIADPAADRVILTGFSPGAGLLVLTDSYHRGWRATLNGTDVEVVRVNGISRGVRLPGGRFEVIFRYRPTSFTIGLLVAALSALTCVALASWRWWRKVAKGVGEIHVR